MKNRDSWFYGYVQASFSGPVTWILLRQLVDQGIVTPSTRVRRLDGEWMTASNVDGLFPSRGLRPDSTWVDAPSDRRRLASAKSALEMLTIGYELGQTISSTVQVSAIDQA